MVLVPLQFSSVVNSPIRDNTFAELIDDDTPHHQTIGINPLKTSSGPTSQLQHPRRLTLHNTLS